MVDGPGVIGSFATEEVKSHQIYMYLTYHNRIWHVAYHITSDYIQLHQMRSTQIKSHHITTQHTSSSSDDEQKRERKQRQDRCQEEEKETERCEGNVLRVTDGQQHGGTPKICFATVQGFLSPFGGWKHLLRAPRCLSITAKRNMQRGTTCWQCVWLHWAACRWRLMHRASVNPTGLVAILRHLRRSKTILLVKRYLL